jgi:hypothetical protein
MLEEAPANGCSALLVKRMLCSAGQQCDGSGDDMSVCVECTSLLMPYPHK